jgi:hypothetical protein
VQANPVARVPVSSEVAYGVAPDQGLGVLALKLEARASGKNKDDSYPVRQSITVLRSLSLWLGSCMNTLR